jgi:hypothetical protein
MGEVESSPVKRNDDSFMSSPFLPVSSPFIEPPITPGKIFAPDFTVLTPNSPQQIQLTASTSATYLQVQKSSNQFRAIMPKSDMYQAYFAAGPQQFHDSKVQEYKKKLERKILPNCQRGKQVDLQSKNESNHSTIGIKRKATDEDCRNLLSSKPKSSHGHRKREPKANSTSAKTDVPEVRHVDVEATKSRTRDVQKKKAVEKVSRSLSFGEKIAGKQNKEKNFNDSPEKRQLEKQSHSAPITSKSGHRTNKDILDNKTKMMLKNMDQKKLNEVLEKARRKASH